jgi:hypothetical protein
MKEGEVVAFLSHLANHANVTASIRVVRFAKRAGAPMILPGSGC